MSAWFRVDYDDATECAVIGDFNDPENLVWVPIGRMPTYPTHSEMAALVAEGVREWLEKAEVIT